MSNKELDGMIKKFSKQSQKIIDDKNKKQKDLRLQKEITHTINSPIVKEREQSSRIKAISSERTPYEESHRRSQFELFTDMWKNEKTHKFLAHLLAAYSPLSVGHFAWTNDELKEDHCCICKHRLVSKEFLFQNLDKEQEDKQ